jgi:hypothetical protein
MQISVSRDGCFPKAMSHKILDHKSYYSPNSKYGSTKLFVEEGSKCACRVTILTLSLFSCKESRNLKGFRKMDIAYKIRFIFLQHWLPALSKLVNM